MEERRAWMWCAVYGALVAERLAEHRRRGTLPDDVEMRRIVADAYVGADGADIALVETGIMPLKSEPGKVAPDGSGALKQRIRDLELERDLAIAARDTARAEARSQRKIAEDARAGRVEP